MIAAILSLTLLGAALGIVLGVANKFLAVEGNPVIDELIAMMPGSNCGQCGFPGCSGAANAIVDGTAPPTCCPPGGKSLAAAIAAKLDLTVDLSAMSDEGPKIAVVAEELVGAFAADHAVRASCPMNDVVAAPAFEAVVAGPAVDRVGRASPEEVVDTRSADERVGRSVLSEHGTHEGAASGAHRMLVDDQAGLEVGEAAADRSHADAIGVRARLGARDGMHQQSRAVVPPRRGEVGIDVPPSCR